MKNDPGVRISRIQRFCMKDGPGLRTTVFFLGCPLSCRWCHNPECRHPSPRLMFYENKCVSCLACADICPRGAQLRDPRSVDRTKCVSCGRCAAVCPAGALELSGRTATVREIMEEVCRDAEFYGDQGGLTVSGGEPTAQPEALLALLSLAGERKINAAVETCGQFSPVLVRDLVPLTDLFLFDVKDTDPERLRTFTGGDADLIYSNLRALDALGAPSVLRCPLIPGVNLNDPHAEALAGLFLTLSHARFAELLPYHPLGISKAGAAGEGAFRFDVPEKKDILRFAGILRSRGVPVKYRGSMI